jgi:hypothetical protein
MESVTGVRRWHNPLVVRLVEMLVNQGVVQITVNPINAKVGKNQEQWKLRKVVPKTGALFGGVVEFAVAANLEHHERCGTKSHERHRLVGLDDLQPDLILDEFRVIQGPLIEDEVVG